MNLSPILRRDLRAEMVSRRLVKARLWAGLYASIALLALIVAERWTDNFNLTRWLRFSPFAGTIPFVLFILGLGRGANLLAAERREEILPLLLLADLTGYDVVLSKVLQALLSETALLLATFPALILPLLMAGFRLNELSMATLGCCNVLFCAMALGLFSSLFGQGARGTGWAWCLFLALPLLANSTALALFFPSGRWTEYLGGLRWLNPCAAVADAQMAAAGFRPGRYWSVLLVSHAFGWSALALSGMLLRWACQRQAGCDATRRKVRNTWWQVRSGGSWPAWRQRLLDRNPLLWVTSREIWPTILLWLLLALPVLLWGWVIWLSWRRLVLNVCVVLIIAIAASWLIAFLMVVPREACRRLVEDRQSGAMELILCTPLDIRGVIRGQWLSLARRYLVPLLSVLVLGVVMMIMGYRSFGFGGMLDAEDRGLWLFCWLTGIVLLPVWLVALCWVAMGGALWARNAGDASTMALLKVVGLPGLGLWATYWLGLWIGCNPNWGALALMFALAYGVLPGVWAWRARRRVLRELRVATANRYSPLAQPKDERQRTVLSMIFSS